VFTDIRIGKAKRYNLKIKYYYNLIVIIMSRSSSRNNSIDLSRPRTSSWDNRRSNSLGSVETIELETDKTIKNVSKITNIKTASMKIIPSNKDKKRARDVYIDINDPYKNPTPTPNSFLEKYATSDLVWIKTAYK
tara:strand:- start:207 stop:611 length:405 start_codon:yes stop_codon:yes gene_type:complete